MRKCVYFCAGPIVQGIEREPPELKIQVRVLVGLQAKVGVAVKVCSFVV